MYVEVKWQPQMPYSGKLSTLLWDSLSVTWNLPIRLDLLGQWAHGSSCPHHSEITNSWYHTLRFFFFQRWMRGKLVTDRVISLAPAFGIYESSCFLELMLFFKINIHYKNLNMTCAKNQLLRCCKEKWEGALPPLTFSACWIPLSRLWILWFQKPLRIPIP